MNPPILSASMILEALRNTPEAVIITAAAVTALGVIWRKVIAPLRAFVQDFKLWMKQVQTAVAWVEAETKTNTGLTLRDRVDRLNKHVDMLLRHDAERDAPGKRYRDPSTDEGE